MNIYTFKILFIFLFKLWLYSLIIEYNTNHSQCQCKYAFNFTYEFQTRNRESLLAFRLAVSQCNMRACTNYVRSHRTVLFHFVFTMVSLALYTQSRWDDLKKECKFFSDSLFFIILRQSSRKSSCPSFQYFSVFAEKWSMWIQLQAGMRNRVLPICRRRLTSKGNLVMCDSPPSR